jgi:hypothetical protein
MAQDLARKHRVPQGRIFVAGLSAGAAMAVILGQTHHDVFAAVGAHSGLSLGAAKDLVLAFAAMNAGPEAIVREEHGTIPPHHFSRHLGAVVHLAEPRMHDLAHDQEAIGFLFRGPGRIGGMGGHRQGKRNPRQKRGQFLHEYSSKHMSGSRPSTSASAPLRYRACLKLIQMYFRIYN